MRRSITVSAPGKLMLFGEHAVLYGSPCLVTAVGQRMAVAVELTEGDTLELAAEDVQIRGYTKPMSELGNGEVPRGAGFVEIAVRNFRKAHPFAGGLRVKTTSEFSSTFGFGSSSAVTVAVIKALAELVGSSLDPRALFDLSYQTVLDVQGKGSGFDVAAAAYGGTLFFIAGGKEIRPINVPDLPLVVGYTGIKADTVTIINAVKEKEKREPELVQGAYAGIAALVEEARVALMRKDWPRLGELMDSNEHLLETLDVGSDVLTRLINAARGAGAWGAKLSGAGVGDCMIALVPAGRRDAVSEAISDAGGQVIDAALHAPGARVE
jgi:mevalonate kinase